MSIEVLLFTDILTRYIQEGSHAPQRLYRVYAVCYGSFAWFVSVGLMSLLHPGVFCFFNLLEDYSPYLFV